MWEDFFVADPKPTVAATAVHTVAAIAERERFFAINDGSDHFKLKAQRIWKQMYVM